MIVNRYMIRRSVHITLLAYASGTDAGRRARNALLSHVSCVIGRLGQAAEQRTQWIEKKRLRCGPQASSKKAFFGTFFAEVFAVGTVLGFIGLYGFI